VQDYNRSACVINFIKGSEAFFLDVRMKSLVYFHSPVGQ
jgi:hypothetical protein